MNDMERRKFEDSFKDAFTSAEVQPDNKVWTNVELDLITAEGEKMKRRILFYQILAAASISFAILVTGIGFYMVNENKQLQLAQYQKGDSKSTTEQSKMHIPSSTHENTVETPDEMADAENKDLLNNKKLSNSNDQHATPAIRNSETEEKGINKNSSAVDESFIASKDSKSEQEGISDRGEVKTSIMSDMMPADDYTSGRGNRPLPPLYESKKQKIVLTKKKEQKPEEADPVALMFARLNDLEKELANEASTKKDKKTREKLWTSVAFAAGSFNTNTPSVPAPAYSQSISPNYSLSNSSVVQNQTKASGIAYTMGISIGTQLTDRWVIQGGVNYLTEMSDFTSTQAIHEPTGTFKAASINEYRSGAMDSNEKFIPTAPYTVNNSNEYFSIPVQAGYLIVKRKLIWQLNAGISTDLFLQNTIDPEGNIEETTQTAGADSPYRSVNFSGLVGSEVSYKFGGHYRLGVNPGIRYPLNSIYKDDFGVSSNPLTFDIGLRFRYIFH
jgi:hypothetical protein